ncbi:hypothetical protein E6P09_13635 [Haloferax mediterranei ATCC 33500]|uniref:VanZ-like domain-containing protein n=1 Tax=Haloferax mediterranei (strain ATCC 33500 / DSM 1411 / JCM 8866 / NBRC 14739 / NCIMB 2177 / R-4) TaxID=523841 RepID=I3R7U6_HALMT|nr:hypothetical protein [Haloferax mediterranei]AFK20306.1 hypothetical protein HFX_2628 [Haloferax mediterranei ATCC 33500]AHZ23675.1 hypothetical protein BM92_13950 [Haloferax mediterranei ATCC 33500]ELZ99162.1 hypothetical protein C439_14924 [Haloferax mediterranei ATCC 33500]MDX5986939.1 hypothetical protein [Haloferax mediterranei ATCC 33500]QCQ76259.1 hypothetical protein E6P09_13635 [Haloferax mediterranei ATCC 33500]
MGTRSVSVVSSPETQSGDWRFWAVAAARSPRVLVFATLAVVSLGLLPLYESIWWWDIAMHSTNSAVIVAWSFRFRYTPLSALVLLFGIGVGWEFLEAMTPHFALMAGDSIDTAGDIVSNTAGWFVATLIRRRVRRLDS